MLFTGEYERTIDAKHRLAIPSEIRSQIDPEVHGKAMYLAPGANGRCWLWPEKIFEAMDRDDDQSLLKPDEVMEFEEFMYSQSHRCEFDKTGRLRLNERMLLEHQIKDTVVILGVKSHLELCDPAQWAEYRKQMFEKRSEIAFRARKVMEEQRNKRDA